MTGRWSRESFMDERPSLLPSQSADSRIAQPCVSRSHRYGGASRLGADGLHSAAKAGFRETSINGCDPQGYPPILGTAKADAWPPGGTRPSPAPLEVGVQSLGRPLPRTPPVQRSIVQPPFQPVGRPRLRHPIVLRVGSCLIGSIMLPRVNSSIEAQSLLRYRIFE